MRKVKELSVRELEKVVKRNEKAIQKLERQNERFETALENKRCANCGYRKGDVIVGKSVVIGQKREVLAKVSGVYKSENYSTGRSYLEVVAWSPKSKKYGWNVKDVRKATKEEVAEYNKREAGF